MKINVQFVQQKLIRQFQIEERFYVKFDESHYYLLRKYVDNNQDVILDAILDNQFTR